MKRLINKLTLQDVDQDLARNIACSIENTSYHLFADLSDRKKDWATAAKIQSESRLDSFVDIAPKAALDNSVVNEAFRNAHWDNAIGYPFTHWMKSRYGDGSYGVWYGADSMLTSIYESVHHWYHGFLQDAGLTQAGIMAERKVYLVHCRAALINLQESVTEFAQILDPHDYTFCQSIGARLQGEGYPGLVSRSVRNKKGKSYAIFNSQVLDMPREATNLSYAIESGQIVVYEHQATATELLRIRI